MTGTTYIRKIDKAGRIVIPSKIRNYLDLKSDQKLIIKKINNKIMISDHIDDLEDKIEMLLFLFYVCFKNVYKISYGKKSFKTNYDLIKNKTINSTSYKLNGKVVTIIEYCNREVLNSETLVILKTLLSEILKNNWNNSNIVLYYFH